MTASKTPKPQAPGGSRLLPEDSLRQAQETITQKLREYYDSVQEEAIPERFLDLLEQLDEAEKRAGVSEKK